MASDIEATCENDPNFAVICAFWEKFGTQCGLPSIDFLDLQGMIEDTDEVHLDLVNIFLKLLRKVKKTVKPDKWERSLVAVCHNFSSQDAWEIERFGYKKAKLTSKVRVLKELLEMQFDFHGKFKNEVNKLTANDLRSKPLGRDKAGHIYWFHSDDHYQIRVYKENLDEKTWTLIAKDREGLVSLINKLSNGEYKFNVEHEERNSFERSDIDTGQNDYIPEQVSELDDSKSKTCLMKNEEENEMKSTIKSEEKPKAKLRIKNICELIDTNLKRPRFEDDNEPCEKLLKINMNKIVVGQAIEEPLIRINVEGNGVDNNDIPGVGGVIEENILYFYGEGSGYSCQTGNEEMSKTNEKNKACNDSQNDSIDSLGVSRNFAKKRNEDSYTMSNGVIDIKIDNDTCNSPANLFELGVENGDEKTNKLDSLIEHSNLNMKTPVEVSKKINLSSTVGFEENIQRKSDDFEDIGSEEPRELSISKNSARYAYKTKSTRESIEDINSISKSSSVSENYSNSWKSSKCKEGSSGQISDDIQAFQEDSSKVDAVGIISPSVNEKVSLDIVSIVEKECIKEVAYACGMKDIGNKINSESLLNSSQNDKGIEKITTEYKNSKDGRSNTKLTLGKLEVSDELENSDEAVINMKVETKSVISNEIVTTNSNKTDEHPKEYTDDFEVNDITPKMSLRSVRSKKLMNMSIKQPEKSPTCITLNEKPDKEKNAPLTDVVDFKGRRFRQKKDGDEIPPMAATKKPKLAVMTDRDKEGITKGSTEKNVEMKPKSGKGGSAASPNSSVSSPISFADSIITFSGSVDSNGLEVLDKDPLAQSDQEAVALKPINLQSFSFDFNDPSTPPHVSNIASTRMLRKRYREISPALKSIADNEGKRKKLKGKRQVDTKLRKSIEQLKDQQVSSSDEDSTEIVTEDSKMKKSIYKSKKKKAVKLKKKKTTIVNTSDESTNHPPPKPKELAEVKQKNNEIVRHPENKNKRLLAGMDVAEIQLNSVRQSRRLAQIKIKEQIDHKQPETKGKEEKKERKKDKISRKTKKETIILSSDPEQEHDETKQKKKKGKAPSKIFDEYRPWKSSSESSEEEGEEAEDEEEPIEDEPLLEFKSDHEFSPESDLNSADEYQPPKRARTARKKYDDDSSNNEKKEDFPCQNCGRSDQPEMVLLCDNCDNGWHCSCLNPPLLSVPEGDWFCPPCQHIKLVENLHAELIEYDKKLTKKGLEDRRKERLAYVGISLNNVLPSREKEQHKNKRGHLTENRESSSLCSESPVSESESSSDEPIYQLRQRRQAMSYKFNEYDELIRSAIQDELNEKEEIAIHCRGKDIATIVKAEVDDCKKNELNNIQNNQSSPEENAENTIEKKYKNDDFVDRIVRPSVKLKKKKNRKMCSLELSSEEDDERDEDFKGSSSSSDEDEDLEEDSEDSDESMLGGRRKNSRPLRRSTRARVSRFGTHLINDDDDDDDIPKKKKKAYYSSESDSSENDIFGRRRKKTGRCDFSKKRTSKNKKNSILEELSDLETVKKKKIRIKYGGLTSSEEEMARGRRTRGKKTTYVDTLGSDSDDAPRKRNYRKLVSDDDEDFVAFEEDDKDSEEVQDDQLEDGDYEGHKKIEGSERRALIVPKIYIKKPSISKVIERSKENTVINEITEVSTKEKNEKFKKNEQMLEISPKNNEEINEEEKHTIRGKNIEVGQMMSEKLKLSLESNTNEKIKTFQKVESNLEQPSSDCIDDNNKDLEHSSKTEINNTDTNLQNENLVKVIMKQEQTIQVSALHMEQDVKKVTKENNLQVQMQITINKKSQPVMREGKPKSKSSLGQSGHQPIISNMQNMIRNDDSNDELSEPPMGVALPLFEELTSKGIEFTKKKREKGKGKKTLEEAVADLGGKKKSQLDSSQTGICNIEIATPPQPFSQAAPTPSVITRMLQTKPGQTSVYPIGSIRPKQFATMPDDDDDSPSSRLRTTSSIVNQPQISGSFSRQYMIGGSKNSIGVSYRPMYINQFPRRNLPPLQIERQPSPVSDIAPRQIHMMPPTRTSAHSPFLAPNATPATSDYYEDYSAESISNEDDVSPTAYEIPQYPESYKSGISADPSVTIENTNKISVGEESGEFGGLVSYFSSQREDDIES